MMNAVSWDRDAKKQLKRVPFFMRPIVRRKVEDMVRVRNRGRVTLRDFKEAEARYRSVAAGKTGRELEQMLPQENRPGVDMVVVETCHNELSGCPNVLAGTAGFRDAIEEWAEKNDISEKLRARIKDDNIYFHNKLRISISGCPNGCSRPQIADFGVAGFVRPYVDPERCTACGSCVEVCPDAAVTVDDQPPVFDLRACQGCTMCRDICPNGCIALSAPGVKITVGGKLGRHPHLAEAAAEAVEPKETVELIDKIVNGYIGEAEPGERFADWWIRTRKEGIK